MYKWIQTSLNQHVKFKKYDRKEFQGNECIWYQTQLLCPRVIIFNNHTPTIFRQGELNFKDQDYQHSSPSEKVFFLPSPPPPSNLHRTFFFPHISQKYHNNRSSCDSDHSIPPPPPSFKRANYNWNTSLLTFGRFEITRKLDLHIKLSAFQKKFPFRRQNPHWF